MRVFLENVIVSFAVFKLMDDFLDSDHDQDFFKTKVTKSINKSKVPGPRNLIFGLSFTVFFFTFSLSTRFSYKT